MGEIGARRKMSRGRVWLPNWGVGAAAVALFGMGYGIAVQFAGPAQNAAMFADTTHGVTAAPATLLQQSLNTPNVAPALPYTPVVDTTDAYESVYAASNSVDIPEDTDPWLREFIELGNEAHNYSRAMRLTHNTVSPDVSQAVMVVDSR
jgi:hypothetical protein